MPIQYDPSKPVRTYDTAGKLVSTDSKDAAPVKVVDSIGRAKPPAVPAVPGASSSPAGSVRAEAAKVAEQAAASMPGLQPAAPAAPAEPAEPAAPAEGEKLTEAKIRKEYLEAQRLKRSAQEMEKKAKANLERAEAFQKAKAAVDNGEDPTAILKAAGLDPVRYYQQLTDYALSEKGRAEEADPVKRELKEHKERLDKYSKDLEQQARTIQDREEMAAHNQVIHEKVIPLLRDNTDQYETLLAHYGNQAAVEVYKNVWEIYQQTGQARSFQEVADEMEKYWSEQVDSGLKLASNLKKFHNRFAPGGLDISKQHTLEPKETPGSVTLSNKQQIASSPSTGNPYKGLTREERVNAILKKFDI